jgi:hypothetical protein
MEGRKELNEFWFHILSREGAEGEKGVLENGTEMKTTGRRSDYDSRRGD